MTGLVRIIVAALFMGASYFSCSSVEETSTCSAMCARYGDCFDAELDVDDCTSDCLESADQRSDTFVRDVDRCEKCMDMEGCRESAFDCFDECGHVTGQSALTG
jgi:hypothetical protein